MERDTVLSLSPSPDVLKTREATLRHGGMKVISVLSPIQARFEIEMGRCGVFLICYRSSRTETEDLTRLFHRNCPHGRVIFVNELPGKNEAPAGVDFAVPESAGPEEILEILKEHGTSGSSERPSDRAD